MGLRRKHENIINPEEDAEDAEDAEHLEKTLQKWLWQKKLKTSWCTRGRGTYLKY